MTSEQMVVFRLGDEEYAVSITQVKEIICYKGANKLPNMPDYLEGIINLRGKIIPVVDLAKRFRLIPEIAKGKQAVIVETMGLEVGVVVDEVTEVLMLDDSAIEPASMMIHAGAFLRGIGKQEERLMIILDLDKLFRQEEQELLQFVG
jgi:purine-binding chemotaxis protein CheW